MILLGGIDECNSRTFVCNPLIKSGKELFCRIESFKKNVKDFYYEVILYKYHCPDCSGQLRMTGKSQAKCELCTHELDPTLSFQQSFCCNTNLVRRPVHYVCSRCNKTVPSKFLFDERIFDKTYFREMMQASRVRAKKRQEEIKRLMVQSRSGVLDLMEEPILEDVPGLIETLDNFIQSDEKFNYDFAWKSEHPFIMTEYKDHILNFLDWGKKLFSKITPLQENCRQDRIWRFVSLIFMQHDGEIELTQHENDIWIKRIYHEAYE